MPFLGNIFGGGNSGGRDLAGLAGLAGLPGLGIPGMALGGYDLATRHAPPRANIEGKVKGQELAAAQNAASANGLDPRMIHSGIATGSPLALVLAHIHRQRKMQQQQELLNMLGALGGLGGRFLPMAFAGGGAPGGGSYNPEPGSMAWHPQAAPSLYGSSTGAGAYYNPLANFAGGMP